MEAKKQETGYTAQILPQVQLIFNTSLSAGVWKNTTDAGAVHSIMVAVTEACAKADKFDALQAGKGEDFRPPAQPGPAPEETAKPPAAAAAPETAE